MLLVLPITPSRISQNFYPLFLIYCHAKWIFDCGDRCCDFYLSSIPWYSSDFIPVIYSSRMANKAGQNGSLRMILPLTRVLQLVKRIKQRSKYYSYLSNLRRNFQVRSGIYLLWRRLYSYKKYLHRRCASLTKKQFKKARVWPSFYCLHCITSRQNKLKETRVRVICQNWFS